MMTKVRVEPGEEPDAAELRTKLAEMRDDLLWGLPLAFLVGGLLGAMLAMAGGR